MISVSSHCAFIPGAAPDRRGDAIHTPRRSLSVVSKGAISITTNPFQFVLRNEGFSSCTAGYPQTRNVQFFPLHNCAMKSKRETPLHDCAVTIGLLLSPESYGRKSQLHRCNISPAPKSARAITGSPDVSRRALSSSNCCTATTASGSSIKSCADAKSRGGSPSSEPG